ncbi:hypothetical protein GLOIN_2v1837963 [Rhizophagus clarus]|uniref:Uncharacterized protein n=1 Tax=Rhizophagus clarus TaxID=94130 RepID=A0A8H3QMD9_9GLOM|nr:hypothetical protein GLOIN_2v1837963 [Rhizophagus clarus]
MDAKQERARVVKDILRSSCKNYLYEYLLQRREQASFTKDIQLEHDGYLAKLHNLENDREFEGNVKIALNGFEMEKKTLDVTTFWDEVKKLKEEETAIRTASLGHLNIFGKTLTQYAYAQEIINEGVKLKTTQKRVNETEGIELSSKKARKSVKSTSYVNIRDQESEKISSEFPSSSDESARDPESQYSDNIHKFGVSNSATDRVASLSEYDQEADELNDKDASNMSIVYNKKTMRDAYLKTRQDLYDHTSQKDWWIEQCNISSNFRQYQVTNIDKLEDGETFCFSSDYEEILSLHHIMLIDLTNMRKPLYVSADERSWRAAIRQPDKPNIASFFRDVMDEYEMVINDIDLLRLKFYEMWGRYCDQVIYSDNERRLFETTQAVTRAFYERMHMYLSNSEKVNNEDTIMHEYIHDTFKETFRDSNYDTIWANGESSSSKYHRTTYGRNKGKKPDMVLYRIIENVAIFCQGGLNKMISSCGGDTGASFGGHICEGHIYFCMMDLKFDGIYRFFQLSEVKLARKLSEFSLVRRLIMEAFFFKCRIDDFYSNRNGTSNQNIHNNFSRVVRL